MLDHRSSLISNQGSSTRATDCAIRVFAISRCQRRETFGNSFKSWRVSATFKLLLSSLGWIYHQKEVRDKAHHASKAHLKAVIVTPKSTLSRARAQTNTVTKSCHHASFRRFISIRCKEVTAFKKEASHPPIRSAEWKKTQLCRRSMKLPLPDSTLRRRIVEERKKRELRLSSQLRDWHALESNKRERLKTDRHFCLMCTMSYHHSGQKLHPQ